MADIQNFEAPQFLSNSSAEEIHSNMLSQLPENMDQTEGGIPWDLTFPSALVISEAVEFVLVELVKNFFPMWAERIMLDYHGQNRGLARKSAGYATGVVTITGKAGYMLNQGAILTTTGINESETILFETTEEAVIGEDGTVDVNVMAVIAGSSGNVAAGRIDRLDIPDENIVSVVNADPTTGGLDIESDDDYRLRLVDYDYAQGESFIGSIADYKRWAMSVNGVGGAEVIPAKDTSGTVRIVLVDVDGKPASEDLCQQVYDYIMKPNNEPERLAPINAVLDVVSPEIITIAISATVELDGSRTLDAVKADFLTRVNEYFVESISKGQIKYHKICSILIGTAGVADHSNLTINGGTANIAVASNQYPNSEAASVVLVE